MICAVVLAAGQSRRMGVQKLLLLHRGHPLLFAMRYRDEILRTYDDSGLRGLLQAHPDDICEAAVDRPGVLEDFDVPEDYQRAEKQGSFRFP